MPLYPRNTRTCGSWYHPLSIAQRRLYLPESRIESAHIHSKMPALWTDESNQSTEIYNGSVVSLPSHMCGPLPKHEEGYQYTLVVICAFSRWIELFPTKTTTAEETARCIHQHFGRWGTADRLRTDNGPAFANDLLKGLANLLGSTNEFTTAYSSEEMASLNEPIRRSWDTSELLYLRHELRINGLLKIYL